MEGHSERFQLFEVLQQATPFRVGKTFHSRIKESTSRLFGDDDRKRKDRLERSELANVLITKRGEYRGGITSSRPYVPVGISFTPMVITPPWRFLVSTDMTCALRRTVTFRALSKKLIQGRFCAGRKGLRRVPRNELSRYSPREARRRPHRRTRGSWERASRQMSDNFVPSMMNLRNRYALLRMMERVTGCRSVVTTLGGKLAERPRCRCRRPGDMISTRMSAHKVGFARAIARQRPHGPGRASNVHRRSLKRAREDARLLVTVERRE